MSDTVLFDEVFEAALGDETLDQLMERQANAVAKGDWEGVRLLDEILRIAAILGTHAVTAEKSRRNNN